MKRLRVRAPAKINLYLRVLGYRSDGYHEIESLFQAVSLMDELILESSEGRCRLEVPGHPELENDDNLVMRAVRAIERPGDVFVVSLHWGGNWGYGIPPAQADFAHALIDEAGVDVVWGHSSHHAKGIEVYHGKLVLYGAGDLINDYEGIAGHEEFRGDLVLPGILVSALGNGVGTYLGFLVAAWLR